MNAHAAVAPPRKRSGYPQLHTPVFSYTVRELVLMGRTPYLVTGTRAAPITSGGRGDRHIGLATCGTARIPSCRWSGSLPIARLAQQTDILLLDEPTAHLDPRNQRLVLETVVALAEKSVSFVISSHNPNSALLYAHQVIVMKGGRVVADGTPAEVLTESTLSFAYDMPVEVIYAANGAARAVMPKRASSNGTGNGHAVADLSDFSPIVEVSSGA